MNADQSEQSSPSERLRRAVREIGQAVPVPDRGPARLRALAASRRPTRTWRAASVPALAAVATVLAVAVVALPPIRSDSDHQPGDVRPAATLPRVFADHSYLTAQVGDSPAGPAVALYRYGIGDALWQTPQTIMVGRNGQSYREIGTAAERGRRYGGSLWPAQAETLLSPNGTRVAVERAQQPTDDVAVVDLTTGRVRRYPVTAGSAVEVLAWSPDSTRLLYLTARYVGDAYGDPRPALATDGEVVLLDLTTGASTTMPHQRGTLDAAFSPDGGLLALQRPEELRIVRLDGTLDRVVPVPPGHRLAGGTGWSPDGRHLAVYAVAAEPGLQPWGLRGRWAPQGLTVLDLTGGPAYQVDGDLRRLLGWRDGGPVLHRGDAIVAVSPDGRQQLPLSRLQPGDDHFVDDVQLATALLPDLRAARTGVDRGPWPWPLRSVVAGTVLVAGYLLLRVFRRRPRVVTTPER